MTFLRLLPVGLAGLAACLDLAADPVKQLPLEHFFRPPLLSNASLSPDGLTVAGTAAVDKGEEQGIALIDLETLKPYAMRWKSGFDIHRPVWVSDKDLLFSVSKWNTFIVGLYRLNRNNRQIEPVIGDDAVVRVVDPMTEDPVHSLVWLPSMRGGGGSTLAYLRKNASGMQGNIDRKMADTRYTNVLEWREQPPLGDVYGFVADWNHQARVVARFRNDKLEYLHRPSRDAEWEPMALDPEDWDVVAFRPDNKDLFVVGYNGEETSGLYTYDVETQQLGELVYRDDYYDFAASVDYKYFQDTLIGISYQRDTPATVWFAPEVEQVQAVVDKLLPERANVIFDWSDDFKILLIGSYSDVRPTEYFVLDLAKPQLRMVSGEAPWIDASQLAKTHVLRFGTSDGLKLEGYLTLPNGGEKPYPMVTLVHGGPWARDTGGYHAETQFLANRGYAVLRVNYRGSTGYGKKISEDPDYEFRLMQDDITEAVQLVVKQGYADPDRLAIMGASFGGYSALCGAAFWPDLYKCAVTVVGVFDWELMIKDRKRQRARYSHQQLLEKLGDPKVAKETFEAISPINHVDKIKIPIFIAHGKDDRNVSVRQSKLLERKLKQNGVPFETFYRAWEGHGFFDRKNRVALYEQIEAFLAEHLK